MDEPERSFLQRVLLTPARRPVRTLMVAALCVALAWLSASRIQPAPSLEPMFPRDTPAARALVRLLNDFSAADSLILLVRAPQNTQDAEAELLGFADRLKNAIDNDGQAREMVLSVSYRPDHLPRRFMREQMAPAGLFYLNDEQFKQMQRRLSTERIRAQVRRNETLIAAASPTADAMSERILQDPLRLHELLLSAMRPSGPSVGDTERGAFIGEDGRTLLVRIRATTPASEIPFTKEFMQTMRGVVKDSAPGALNVQYGGAYPVAELSATVIRRDMIRSVVISMVLLQVLFLVAYRNLWSFPVTFLPVAAGILAGFGLFAFYAQRMTPVTGAAGAILAGLGIDYCIHYISHYKSRRTNGDGPVDAARGGATLAPALGAACVTSLIGFGAIAVPALRDFALVGAFGLGGAFLGALFVLPALLRLSDRPGGFTGGASLRFRFDPLIVWIVRHRRAWVAGCTGVFVAALGVLVALGPSGFNPSMMVMHPQPSPPQQAQEAIEAQFPAAMNAAHVYMEADSPRDLLINAHELDVRLNSDELRAFGVAAPLSLAQLLPDPRHVNERRAAIAQLDAERIISDFRAAIADSAFAMDAYEDYVGFLRTMLRAERVPDVSTLARYPELARLLLPRAAVGDDAQPATSAVTMVRFDRRFESYEQRVNVLERIESQLAGLPNVAMTGMDLVSMKVQATIERDLPRLLIAAAVLVALWLALVYRHPGRMALTLIPAVFAMVVLLAVMALTGQQLNLVSTIALPLLAGIGVDDGIFLVSIARRQRGNPDAMIHEMAASCHAITMTSVTTTLAFGSLMLTRTPAIQSLGAVLAVGMIGCWAGSLLLLAPLLCRSARGR